MSETIIIKARDWSSKWASTELAWRAIFIIGLFLRLRQYLANRSFWGDEASLAVNIVDRSFWGLMEPLGYHQAAPLGFLFIEKFSIVLLWNADYILRIFPLFAGVAALYFFCKIAKDYMGTAGMFAAAMFALNPMLIFYSSELKQYSGDVLSAVMLPALAMSCFQPDVRRKHFVMLGAAGALMIWVSHVSIFVLAAIGIALVFERLIGKKYDELPLLFGVGMVWLASFGLDYLIALRHTAGDEYFQTYWQRRFVPMPPWSNPEWFVQTAYFFLFTIVSSTAKHMMQIITILTGVGIVSFFITKRPLAWMLTLPFLITLAASALRAYPLTYRFMIFLTPYALFFMAEGIRAFFSFLLPRGRGLALSVCFILAAFLITGALPIAWRNIQNPQTISEIRPIVQYVAENRKHDDRVYIYYGAVPGVVYYAPFYQWNIDSNLVMFGAYRQNEEKAFQRFFEDFQALKGQGRVWFIFNEVVNCGDCEGDPLEYFRAYLSRFGTLLDSVLDVQSAAYLFDLNR